MRISNHKGRLVLSVTLSILVLVTAACSSTTHLADASSSYYLDGPTAALARLDPEKAPPRDAALIAMEQAVALQELGDYEESNRVLAQAINDLDHTGDKAADAALTLVVNDRAATYRGEPFERVFLHTLAISNHLALQNLDDAAIAGEQALEAIETSGCPACAFPFTRYLAAISFDHVGQRERALEVLAEAVAESPEIPFLADEMDRLAGAEPESDDRDMYVFLLLGRGPEKVEQGVGVFPSHAVAWPRYVARPPGAVARARLETDDGTLQTAARLTDMERLAVTSLKSRMSGLVAKETAKTIAQEVALQHLGDEHGYGLEFLARTLFALADRADLRHWSMLPASCQVLRVNVPEEVDSVTLVYASKEGEPVQTEELALPPDWDGNSLFVTRRVP